MSVLRHLPAPASEPPYDDEHAGHGPVGLPSGAVQGTLALAFVLPSGLPATPAPPPDLRLVPRPAAEEDADAVDFGPQPTATAALPTARAWSARFAQAAWSPTAIAPITSNGFEETSITRSTGRPTLARRWRYTAGAGLKARTS